MLLNCSQILPQPWGLSGSSSRQVPPGEVGREQWDILFLLGVADGSGLSLSKGDFLPRDDGIQISSPVGEGCLAPELRKASPASEIMGKLWDLWRRLKEGQRQLLKLPPTNAVFHPLG